MYMRLLLPTLLLAGCESSSDQNSSTFQTGEYISRNSNEFHFTVPPQTKQPLSEYPWSIPSTKINKYSFRCKGDYRNPLLEGHFDCGSANHHSLPLRDNEEFIYPILINLLNYIQDKSGYTVVITSGHRCPEHNTYIDPSTSNQTSKHLIGAEVSFYLASLENDPIRSVELVKRYYLEHPQKKTISDFTQFQRYDKDDVHLRTPPWYNKEVFIKLYQPDEGRNGDNKHPYPYISIQVRWDEQLQQRVNYSWDKSFKGFYRN